MLGEAPDLSITPADKAKTQAAKDRTAARVRSRGSVLLQALHSAKHHTSLPAQGFSFRGSVSSSLRAPWPGLDHTPTSPSRESHPQVVQPSVPPG